jgi:hypothetical protein
LGHVFIVEVKQVILWPISEAASDLAENRCIGSKPLKTADLNISDLNISDLNTSDLNFAEGDGCCEG